MIGRGVVKRITREERGQGSLEGVGVVVLASVLVAATVGTVVQTSPSLRSEVGYRVCQVTSLGSGDCDDPGDVGSRDGGQRGGPSARQAPDEPCVVSSSSVTAGGDASFVASAGLSGGFLIEHLSDGTVRVTRTGEASAGAGVGLGVEAGATVDGSQSGGVAFADANLALAAQGSETWLTGGPEEAQQLILALQAEAMADTVAPELPGLVDVPFVQDIPGIEQVPILGTGTENPLNTIIDDLAGSVIGAGVPEPDEQAVLLGIEGDAGATATILALPGAIPAQGLDLGLDYGSFVGARTTPDGYVLTSVMEADVAAFAALNWTEHNGALQDVQIVRELHLAPDGTPQSVTLHIGGTGVWESDDTGPSVDRYPRLEGTVTVPLTGDPAADAATIAASANPVNPVPFIEQALAEGTAVVNEYEVDPNTYGLNLGVDIPVLGRGVGGSIEGDLTNSTLVSSQAWNGSEFVDRGC